MMEGADLGLTQSGQLTTFIVGGSTDLYSFTYLSVQICSDVLQMLLRPVYRCVWEAMAKI